MIVLAHILTKKQVNNLVKNKMRKKPSNKLSPMRFQRICMSNIEIIISKYSIIDLKHKLKSLLIPYIIKNN